MCHQPPLYICAYIHYNIRAQPNNNKKRKQKFIENCSVLLSEEFLSFSVNNCDWIINFLKNEENLNLTKHNKNH